MRFYRTALAWSLFTLLTICPNLPAAPTNSGQARKAVTGWLKGGPRPMGASLNGSVKEVQSFTDDQGQTTYYIVYLRSGGFVIVPADDEIEPIIGFVASGIYDPSNTNPLGALVGRDMGNRIKGVRAISQQKTSSSASTSSSVSHAGGKWKHLTDLADSPIVSNQQMGGMFTVSDIRVSPLVQSRWDQASFPGDSGYLYNYYTPSHYVCGCVATALSQVLRFFEHPTEGIGSHSYSIMVDGTTQTAWTRGGDGLGGPYDWSQMPLVPNSSITTIQRQAIGALCYDAGVSMNMKYAADMSGASELGASALRSLFGYSNAVRGHSGNFGTNIGDGLIAMINPNLDAGAPVLLGIAGSGGHAIVADGYGYNLETLYHHLNLGWSGAQDAWYNLPTVNAGYYSFNTVGECVYNIFITGSGEIVSGRVTNATGDPIDGAVVTAERTGGGTYTATTNERGMYVLSKIPSASEYTVTVAKGTYVFSAQTVSTGTSADNAPTSGNQWGIDFVADADCPLIKRQPTSLSFVAPTGGPNPVSQILSIQNSGIGTLEWTLTKTQPWLTLSTDSGSCTTGTSVVTIGCLTGSLTEGTYTDTITITAPGASNSPQAVTVTFRVTEPLSPPSVPANPSPADGATNVSVDTNLSWSNFLYAEDFNDGLAQDWAEDTDTAWNVTDGVYTANVVPNGTSAQYTGQIFGDGLYEIDMQTSDEPARRYLAIRMAPGFLSQSQGTAYVFGISPGDGVTSVWKIINGVGISLQPWCSFGFLNGAAGAWNHLAVNAVGNTFHFYVNGHLAWRGTDDSSPWMSGYVGIVGYPKTGASSSHHYFDNVTVKPPLNPETLGAPSISETLLTQSDRSLIASPSPADYSTTYDVYFGSDPNALTQIGTGLTTVGCDPTPSPGESLAYNTSYFWKVVAKNLSGQTEGPIWSFTTSGLPAPVVQSLAPNYASLNSVVTVTDLVGMGFQTGATVKLTKTGQPDIVAADVVADSATHIHCTFNIDVPNSAAGPWDVVVTNPDNQTGTLTGGFRIIGLPAAPANPTPADNATDVPVTTNLSWIQAPIFSTFGATAGQPIAPTDHVDTVGSAATAISVAYGQSTGNLFSVSRNVTLTQIEMWLGIPTATTLRFFVYERSPGTNNMTKILDREVKVPGAGTTWYSSGPIATSLWAGRTYYIGFGWEGTITYFTDIPTSRSVFFGNQISGGGNHIYPPPNIIVQPTSNGTAEYQRLSSIDGPITTFDVFVGTDPNNLVKIADNITETTYDPTPLPEDELLVSTQYFWKVVARNVSGQTQSPIWSFTTIPPAVAHIVPTFAFNHGAATITTVMGAHFQPGATVTLTKAGQPDVLATSVTVDSNTHLTCTLSPQVSDSATGLWNVVVTNPDGATGMLSNGFAIVGPPSASDSPTPANAATGISPATNLSWSQASTLSAFSRSDTVGGTLKQYSFQSSGVGNLYGTVNDVLLTQIETWLTTTATTTLQYFIYEATDSSGVDYTLVYTKTVTTPSAGTTWYSSGPIQVPLQANKWYCIGVAWTSSSRVTYHLNFGVETYPVSFGLQSSGHSAMPVPIPTTIHTGGPEAPNKGSFYQRLTTCLAPLPTFDVYLGTASDNLTKIADNTTTTTCDPSPLSFDALNPQTPYFWKVIARNIAGQTEGPTWSFQTKSVIPGDANWDDQVNFSDYLLLSQNYGATDARWGQGDFNNDQSVGFTDYLILSQNFGTSGGIGEPETPAASASQVAEVDDSASMDEQTDALEQAMPCLPAAMVILAMTGLAIYSLGLLRSQD